MRRFLSIVVGRPMVVLTVAFAWAAQAPAADPPQVGETAQDFELKTLQQESVNLSELTKSGPVVLLVLRGYPGYQCPLCTKQVGDFVEKADKFAEAKAEIVLIYPGPADKLASHADDFLRGKTLPKNVHFVIDPDYQFVSDYGLRWDAPKETAYPSTFIVDSQRKIRYAKVSKSHGGRSKAAEVLQILTNLD